MERFFNTVQRLLFYGFIDLLAHLEFVNALITEGCYLVYLRAKYTFKLLLGFVQKTVPTSVYLHRSKRELLPTKT